MHRGIGPALLVLALLLAVTLVSVNFSIANAASLTADQQCSSIGGSFLDSVGTQAPAGQTFIPTQSSIVSFALFLRSTNLVPTPMTLSVLSGGIGGPLVGSVDFSVPSGFGSPTGNWLTVQFPSGLSLTPHAIYALDLRDNSASSGIKWDACATPYANGCGYADGVCQANSWGFIEYAGDYSLGLSTTGLTVAQGSTGTITVLVGSQSNFASPVTLSLSGQPTGVTGTFSANPGTASSGMDSIATTSGGTSTATLSIFVPGTVAVGTYPVTVTASSGPTSHSASLTLTVTSGGTVVASASPDFIAQPSPVSINLSPGSFRSTTVILSSVSGFNSQVDLATSWVGAVPVDVTVSLPSPVVVPAGGTTTSTLTLNAGNSASTGTFTLSITATGGGIAHSTQITVNVVSSPAVLVPVVAAAPDFTLAPSSSTLSTTQGLSTSTDVIVNSVGGFSSPVTFSASWVGSAPTGVSLALPQPVTPPPGSAASSTVGISTTGTASTGAFVLQITGTSGSVEHSTDINLQVNSPGAMCIIATATYGSAVAPQVELLRNFRDNAILPTRAGASFMTMFNAWYYSFSPQTANQIANNWAARSVMQIVLSPLIGILTLSSATFHATSALPELAVLLAGILASGLIGAFYLGLPLTLLRAKQRFRAAKVGRLLERTLVVTLAAGIGILAIGELANYTPLLMTSSATIVLSTMLLSATATSNRLSTLKLRK